MIINWIKQKFHKPELTDEQKAILLLHSQLEILESHLIALSRLQFIKPERLVEEATDIKANGEYLLQMLKSQEDKNAKAGR